ncbi:MAG: HDIG domain-containing protein [Planctomycetes bacterium]|nr:HDIG domain-containing protein [Planctomycetota bacterium]
MGGTATSERRACYTAIPMAGLVKADAVPFPLYLRTASDTWVLYRPEGTLLDESHIGRLHAEGVPHLYIADEHRGLYFERIEGELDSVLLDKRLTVDERADVLYGVSTLLADDLLGTRPDQATVQRARKVMMATSGLLLREGQGFHALRRVMQAGPELARHSLTVAFLSMGLARLTVSRDAASLATVGLAGLLHDVGRVGYEELDHDPEHTSRGAKFLRSMHLPQQVVEAAESHHECHDGSGFPSGSRGEQIPVVARLIGVVDRFDKIYSTQEPRVGVFDALRILAQAYRGCFDERLAQGLVKLFR